MAVAQAQTVLPRILKSETTLQYHIPRNRPQKFYTPRFTLPQDKFNNTVGTPWLSQTDPLMPPYPYGKNVRFPEADLGLYGGASIQSGNKISKGRNKGKTVRKWFPNVKVETLKSDALDQTMTLPVTARVKRTIAKCGGLDQYVLGRKPARIKELGLMGWKLRWLVLNSPKFKDMSAERRRELGLPPSVDLEQTFEEAWASQKVRTRLIEEQEQKWQDLKEKDQRFRTHWQQLLVGDKAEKTDIPDLLTLQLHSPKTLGLPESVTEK